MCVLLVTHDFGLFVAFFARAGVSTVAVQAFGRTDGASGRVSAGPGPCELLEQIFFPDVTSGSSLFLEAVAISWPGRPCYP